MAYEQSIKTRKDKIQKKLDSVPTPLLARKIKGDLKISEDIDLHLKKIQSPLCEFDKYQPVSKDSLCESISKIVRSGIIESFKNLTQAKHPFVFSTSMINKNERQIFWDIVSPTLKFQGFGA